MIDLNRIAQQAGELKDGHADYFWLAEQVPALLEEIERLKAENYQLRDELATQVL
jgi:regulator of replication initiation timing